LPPHCRLGDNFNAFLGGFRLWNAESGQRPAQAKKPRTLKFVHRKGA
jgi:hypothetical protein